MPSFIDTTCCAGLRCGDCLSEDALVAFRRSRRLLVGLVSGAVFSIGWWIFIDALVITHVRQVDVPIKFEDWVCGIMGTISLLAINIVDKSLISADSYYGDDIRRKARLYIFVCLIVSMGALIGSIVILAVKYTGEGYKGDQLYPGIAIVVQNVLIFISSKFLWFLRGPGADEWY